MAWCTFRFWNRYMVKAFGTPTHFESQFHNNHNVYFLLFLLIISYIYLHIHVQSSWFGLLRIFKFSTMTMSVATRHCYRHIFMKLHYRQRQKKAALCRLPYVHICKCKTEPSWKLFRNRQHRIELIVVGLVCLISFKNCDFLQRILKI